MLDFRKEHGCICLCPENFIKAELKSNELICSAVEMSNWDSILTVAWLLLTVPQLCHEERNTQPKDTKDVQSVSNFKITDKARTGRGHPRAHLAPLDLDGQKTTMGWPGTTRPMQSGAIMVREYMVRK